MSQPGHRQLEHLPLGRIHQRVLSQFWLWFAGPWDILTQKQAVCLWGQSCEDLGWYHIARLSHAFSKSKKRPTACCLRANASRRYLSRLTRWSVVLRCFLKPHWLLSSIPDFSTIGDLALMWKAPHTWTKPPPAWTLWAWHTGRKSSPGKRHTLSLPSTW